MGERAGGLSAEAAAWTGLLPGTAVAVANVDAHVAVPAATVIEAGRMVMIMGTSTCHIVLRRGGARGPGHVRLRPGRRHPRLRSATRRASRASATTSAGSSSTPCRQAYARRGPRARHRPPRPAPGEGVARSGSGESGLLALDWWNGNRSVLVDAGLGGLLVGATLATVPEEIYRALIEATAFGTRVIIETFEAHGVPVDEIVACGGLAEKSPLIMQIYADVTGRPFKLSASDQTPALGSAMFGAVAAGAAAGGHATIEDAVAGDGPARRTSSTSRSRTTARSTTSCTASTSACTTTSAAASNDVMKVLKGMRERARVLSDATPVGGLT